MVLPPFRRALCTASAIFLRCSTCRRFARQRISYGAFNIYREYAPTPFLIALLRSQINSMTHGGRIFRGVGRWAFEHLFMTLIWPYALTRLSDSDTFISFATVSPRRYAAPSADDAIMASRRHLELAISDDSRWRCRQSTLIAGA